MNSGDDKLFAKHGNFLYDLLHFLSFKDMGPLLPGKPGTYDPYGWLDDDRRKIKVPSRPASEVYRLPIIPVVPQPPQADENSDSDSDEQDRK